MAPFKVCSCCRRVFSRKQWGHLKLKGLCIDEVERMEFRDCTTPGCANTLVYCTPSRGPVPPPPEVRS